jgi:hypothetical protein
VLLRVRAMILDSFYFISEKIMTAYHKINSVFKRDGKNFTNEFARPEFEYLKDLHWIGTEKNE